MLCDDISLEEAERLRSQAVGPDDQLGRALGGEAFVVGDGRTVVCTSDESTGDPIAFVVDAGYREMVLGDEAVDLAGAESQASHTRERVVLTGNRSCIFLKVGFDKVADEIVQHCVRSYPDAVGRLVRIQPPVLAWFQPSDSEWTTAIGMAVQQEELRRCLARRFDLVTFDLSMWENACSVEWLRGGGTAATIEVADNVLVRREPASLGSNWRWDANDGFSIVEAFFEDMGVFDPGFSELALLGEEDGLARSGVEVPVRVPCNLEGCRIGIAVGVTADISSRG